MRNKWQHLFILVLGLWIIAMSIYAYFEFGDSQISDNSFPHRLEWLESIIGRKGLIILFIAIGITMLIVGIKRLMKRKN